MNAHTEIATPGVSPVLANMARLVSTHGADFVFFPHCLLFSFSVLQTVQRPKLPAQDMLCSVSTPHDLQGICCVILPTCVGYTIKVPILHLSRKPPRSPNRNFGDLPNPNFGQNRPYHMGETYHTVSGLSYQKLLLSPTHLVVPIFTWLPIRHGSTVRPIGYFQI